MLRIRAIGPTLLRPQIGVVSSYIPSIRTLVQRKYHAVNEACCPTSVADSACVKKKGPSFGVAK